MVKNKKNTDFYIFAAL